MWGRRKKKKEDMIFSINQGSRKKRSIAKNGNFKATEHSTIRDSELIVN